MNRGNRRRQPTASDLVRVMTDSHAEGYHGRPAPARARRGAKGPGSHITTREIDKSMYRPVEGRQVSHIEDGMIMYTPTEEEYRQRRGGAPELPFDGPDHAGLRENFPDVYRQLNKIWTDNPPRSIAPLPKGKDIANPGPPGTWYEAQPKPK